MGTRHNEISLIDEYIAEDSDISDLLRVNKLLSGLEKPKEVRLKGNLEFFPDGDDNIAIGTVLGVSVVVGVSITVLLTIYFDDGAPNPLVTLVPVFAGFISAMLSAFTGVVGTTALIPRMIRKKRSAQIKKLAQENLLAVKAYERNLAAYEIDRNEILRVANPLIKRINSISHTSELKLTETGFYLESKGFKPTLSSEQMFARDLIDLKHGNSLPIRSVSKKKELVNESNEDPKALTI